MVAANFLLAFTVTTYQQLVSVRGFSSEFASHCNFYTTLKLPNRLSADHQPQKHATSMKHLKGSRSDGDSSGDLMTSRLEEKRGQTRDTTLLLSDLGSVCISLLLVLPTLSAPAAEKQMS